MQPENKKSEIDKDYDKKLSPEFDPLKQAEQKGTVGGLGGGKKGADGIAGIGGLKNAESSPAGFYKPKPAGVKTSSSKPGGFLAAAKKRSPIVAIIITLVGGGLGISGLLSPGLLLVHVKETFSNALDNASPALSIRSNKMLFYKFKTAKNSFSQSSDGKCNIRCKFGSMNDTMKRNLEARGFKVDAEEGHGLSKKRYIIKSLTFPDGTRVTNGKDFGKALSDPKRAVSFKRVFNSRIAYFLNSKFGVILKNKFGLNKVDELTAKLKESAKNKAKSLNERFKEAMRSTLGLPEVDPNAHAPSTNEEFEAKLNETGKFKGVVDFVHGPIANAGMRATNIAGYACSAYNIARGITYATKVAKIAALASFAMIFLKAADEIKAGDADPDVVAQLSNQLTQVADPTDPNSKSATNSLGYRMADNGDQGVLTDTDKTYSAAIGSTKGIALLATILYFLGKSGKAGMTTARYGCRVAGNPVVSVIFNCPEELAAGAATGIETAGVGALIAAGICIGKSLAMAAIWGNAIGAFLSKIIPIIAATEIPKLGGDLVGSAAGDAIYTGTAQIMGGEAASYGLKAGTKQQIAQYAMDTATIRQQEDAIASYDAQNTPFDITNQYSFLGRMAQALNIEGLFGSSLATSAGGVLSIVPRSFSSLTNTAGAEAYKKADLYGGKCVDTGLDQIGVDADAFCNPSYVMSGDEMNANIEATINYMADNNYIDKDTGNPKEPLDDNDYQKYLDNCANRVDPLGEASVSIEDGDYYWKVGDKCMDQNEMMSNFRTYTMDQSISGTMDGDTVESTTATTPVTPTPTTATGNNLLLFGGSIACKMNEPDKGNIGVTYKAAGWNLVDNCQPGRDFTEALAEANRPEVTTNIKNANKIVIALGANNLADIIEQKRPQGRYTYTGSDVFNSKMKTLYETIRTVNPNATYYWVNYGLSGYSPNIKEPVVDAASKGRRMGFINSLIEQFANENGIKIIDWAGHSNINDYQPKGGIHPSSPDGIRRYSTYVLSRIGTPPR